ncbi:MAG: glycoside hydrolase family 57 [Nitrospirae bacterium]|nr:glycoside hydrolase family 57 [Nitrospirota bacterium]
MLRLYSVFHLNIAYSSVPEAIRKEVVQKCFWPLLDIATEHNIPLAIESPAYTLEVVAEIEPEWIIQLRNALQAGKVEFIGSGYSQLIAPLVPAGVNEWNLKTGKEIYGRLLNYSPDIWYVNEQAYSAGIVEHYCSLGAGAIIMEWNNPRTLHPEWKEEFRYYPQIAEGVNGSRIPVIWNDSIAFQKFQRFAHGDIDWEDIRSYLLKHKGGATRNFCLYGNDAEIFDFRPGRFRTEPQMSKTGEWTAIRELYLQLMREKDIALIFPSSVLDTQAGPHAFASLALESPAQPIPVKKQPKYNVTRWAVTGRNSLHANTLCYNIARRLDWLDQAKSIPEEKIRSLSKTLCYLWSSDFRTHVTAERWEGFLSDLENTREEVERIADSCGYISSDKQKPLSVNGLQGDVYTRSTYCVQSTASKESIGTCPECSVHEDGRFIDIVTPSVEVRLNKRRGLAIHRLVFPQISSQPLAGTILHGYFDDINLSADWYTANTVLQRPGKPQITDLQPCEASISLNEGRFGGGIGFQGETHTEAGPIMKKFFIYRDIPQIDIEILCRWAVVPHGSFKTGMVTLMPESFEQESLFYATHNGGCNYEVFPLAGATMAHDAPGSSIVTASHGLGATEGVMVLGDSHKGIAIIFDQTICAAMPMLVYKNAAPSFFCRLFFSCGEMDESRVQQVPGPVRFVCSISGLKGSI